MSLVTCKFGGTSLADAENIRRVEKIIHAGANRRFIVPSAPGKRAPDDRKITDLLYAWHGIAVQGLDPSEPRELIADRFEGLARDLGVRFDTTAHFAAIDASLAKALETAPDGTRPTADFLASRGEFLNGCILAELLGATFVDPAECIRFTVGGDLDPVTYELFSKRLQGNGRFVIPGFYGAYEDGRIKTFSRGGSDITGAIVARASGSVLYENWTDVSGFRMTDPRIVPEAKRMDEVTYQELRELSYMGATVLHDEAIYPVRSDGIPIQIRNTMDPEDPGTRIVPSRTSTHPVCGIAGRKGFTMINVQKTFMNHERGFGRRILSVLEEHGMGWEHMPTGIDTISLILRDEELGPLGGKIVEDIERHCCPDSVSLQSGIAMIATVGQGMHHHIGVAARLFTAIANAGINLRVIDQGSSEMNIIIGVEDKDLHAAVRSIYDAFAEWE
ncbi:MAG: aspartate kinase [Candidatus Hydrogenedentes bacterium]|nr:aspartate kinase [Candidatus Hydrogenedentota bacterium]